MHGWTLVQKTIDFLTLLWWHFNQVRCFTMTLAKNFQHIWVGMDNILFAMKMGWRLIQFTYQASVFWTNYVAWTVVQNVCTTPPALATPPTHQQFPGVIRLALIRCVSRVHFAKINFVKIHFGRNIVTRTKRIDNFEQRFSFGNCPNHLTNVMSQSFPSKLTIY